MNGDSRTMLRAMALLVAVLAPANGYAAAIGPAAPVNACMAALAGSYRASHIEMAGELVLGEDGRFRYALSYGALDEEAAGRWSCSADAVVLDGDPVRPPRFVVADTGPAPAGELRIALDLPKGISRQYFGVLVRDAGGQIARHQFAEDGLTLHFEAKSRPLAIVPLLPVYEIAGEPVAMPAGEGAEIRLRFEVNDLGKVAFVHAPLRRDGADLALDRFGEAIRFERSSARRGG